MSPNVLLIDADLATRSGLTTGFPEAKLHFDMAANRDEVVGKILEHSYDVILLDLTLPTVAGFTILVRVKLASPELLRRVVICTELRPATLQGICDERMVWRVLRKPFETVELVAAVRACASKLDPSV